MERYLKEKCGLTNPPSSFLHVKFDEESSKVELEFPGTTRIVPDIDPPVSLNIITSDSLPCRIFFYSPDDFKD